MQGKQQAISGIDPATIADFYTFAWTTGSDRTLDQLGSDGALVSKSYAEDQQLKVGSPVSRHDAVGREAHARSSRASTTRRRRSRCWVTSA